METETTRLSRNTSFSTFNWDVIAEIMKSSNAPPELVERWGLYEKPGVLKFIDLDGHTLLEVEVIGTVERITTGDVQGYRFELLSKGEAKELGNVMRY